MTNLLILGAAGQIAQWAVRLLAQRDDVRLTLFVRDAAKLGGIPPNAVVVEGDATDLQALQAAMHGQDMVYANLFGEMDVHAANIVAAMESTGVKRVVFVSSLGIYDEVPGAFGEWNRREIGSYLPPYRRAADILEASGLDYTVLRPAWLQDQDEINYATTSKGAPFQGTEVSRKSVAAVVVAIVDDPQRWSRANIGIHKPGTDGDKPAFI
ncbi:MAG: SDR family oxidoreductase [Piscinibacter sp.]|uniref:SDR family oxidoreductase n=1 Tax=Piscinibacter sp. TaxID=1903157 RepID=UPI001B448261|nr:SDR family oxidoreductase [Piscinibacter sp.]MBP5988786.1 SDR family oxidoreductase [Piscinibacter sp.]MBP6025725.1 SDR family oxidoreductase [Piscinibacter sp.]